MIYPTPHLEKLSATLDNNKLPDSQKPQIRDAINTYHRWIDNLRRIISNGTSSDQVLEELVSEMNRYKLHMDLNVIFDSSDDFLYRQKGQLKLDNSIIEEFLPYLINDVTFPEIDRSAISVGSAQSFSAVYFETTLNISSNGGGLRIRTKAQDFAISKKLYMKASHLPNFDNCITTETNLAYVAAECKTNLDKTMFQEACATAHDVKSAVPGAKYFLVCEWLDMTPLSTAPTDIDEVLILRRAKRLNSNVRSSYNTYAGRQAARQNYVSFLQRNPISVDVLKRFVANIKRLISNEVPDERNVLEMGYF